ncbi:MAG: hypothetical protein GEEBNDBF_00838 [bacterium]|nr:hypothetical protein [bacterium]
MTRQLSQAPLAELVLLLALSLVLLTGCGGGGGGTASTILAFTDDFGAPITNAGSALTAQVSGGALTSALTVTAGNDGRVSVNLDPGTYTVSATYRRKAAAILISATQSITVAETDKGKVQQIRLKDNDLSLGWQRFRAGDYPGAIAAFVLYEARAAAANIGANNANNALGWARVRNGELSAGDAAFNLALAADPNNFDAFVGKSGLLLLRNTSSADLTEAITRLSTVIDAPGDYTSAPTHDNITEPDLFVCRAFAHFMQGDLANVQANLDAIRPQIAGGSDAGIDLFNTLDLLLRN